MFYKTSITKYCLLLEVKYIVYLLEHRKKMIYQEKRTDQSGTNYNWSFINTDILQRYLRFTLSSTHWSPKMTWRWLMEFSLDLHVADLSIAETEENSNNSWLDSESYIQSYERQLKLSCRIYYLDKVHNGRSERRPFLSRAGSPSRA